MTTEECRQLALFRSLFGWGGSDYDELERRFKREMDRILGDSGICNLDVLTDDVLFGEPTDDDP